MDSLCLAFTEKSQSIWTRQSTGLQQPNQGGCNLDHFCVTRQKGERKKKANSSKLHDMIHNYHSPNFQHRAFDILLPKVESYFMWWNLVWKVHTVLEKSTKSLIIIIIGRRKILRCKIWLKIPPLVFIPLSWFQRLKSKPKSKRLQNI